MMLSSCLPIGEPTCHEKVRLNNWNFNQSLYASVVAQCWFNDSASSAWWAKTFQTSMCPNTAFLEARSRIKFWCPSPTPDFLTKDFWLVVSVTNQDLGNGVKETIAQVWNMDFQYHPHRKVYQINPPNILSGHCNPLDDKRYVSSIIFRSCSFFLQEWRWPK